MSERIIDLTVRNHPGVISHVSGLFARRAYNIEGILCWPAGGGGHSRMLLLVRDNGRLPQLVKQLNKLYDVLEVTDQCKTSPEIFRRLGDAANVQT